MNNLDSFEVLNSNELLEINGGGNTSGPFPKQPTKIVTIKYPSMRPQAVSAVRPARPSGGNLIRVTASHQKQIK